MPLNGAALKFIESEISAEGFPGGKTTVTIQAQPSASGGGYPALGEPILALLQAVWALPSSYPKVLPTVKPSVVWINDNLGHTWAYDKTQAGMGTIRNWTSSGNTPTEHTTGAYSGNETSAILTIEMEFPLYSGLGR